MTRMGVIELLLSGPDDTSAAGERLARHVQPGDCILLSGDIGAGKTHLVRALIQSWLREAGLWDDVPSPTFTLVQSYSNGRHEIRHADLYRLTSPAEIDELGLFEAMEDTVLLVEWPDRLGDALPSGALRIDLSIDGTGRRLSAQGPARLVDALGGAS